MKLDRITTALNLPNGISPEQSGVLIIDHVVNVLSSAFKFGYWERDDIMQEGRLFALQAIANSGYNPSRPLEKFLYTHVRYRYLNLHRDKYFRNVPPCIKCPFYDPTYKASLIGCTAFADKHHCQKFDDWSYFCEAKKKLVNPPSDFEYTPAMHDDTIEYRELFEVIDERLPEEYRDDYIRLRDGLNVPEPRKSQIRHIVALIIEDTDG
jgi:DNA-directed RNA polymerase specialized sigma24 family protein